MSGAHRKSTELAHGAAQFEALTGLDRALDLAYRRVREAAKTCWEARFAETPDPSDACVTVRVIEKKGMRGSGFLTKAARVKTSSTRKLPLPHFAR